MPTTSPRDLPRAESLPERRRHRVRSEDTHRRSREQPPRDVERFDSPAPRLGRSLRILTGLQTLIVDDDRDILELFEMALTCCWGDVTVTDDAAASSRHRGHRL